MTLVRQSDSEVVLRDYARRGKRVGLEDVLACEMQISQGRASLNALREPELGVEIQ